MGAFLERWVLRQRSWLRHSIRTNVNVRHNGGCTLPTKLYLPMSLCVFVPVDSVSVDNARWASTAKLLDSICLRAALQIQRGCGPWPLYA